jgi:hypothetical protein
MPDFRDPILKLERAKHHISDLNAKCSRFYDSLRTTFFIEDDTKTHKRTLRVRVDQAIPNSFSLIIGDAIHNMRSALDHLTWDVLKPFKPIPNRVQFPFCKTIKSFESVLKDRQILIAADQIIRKFRNLKPYPGGNDILYALHVLDIADKHPLVVPVISNFCFDVFDPRKFDPSAPAGMRREKIAFNIFKDNRLAVWGYDPTVSWTHPKQIKNINVAAQIVLPKEAPFGGKSVPAILQRMAMEVSSVIRKFRD